MKGTFDPRDLAGAVFQLWSESGKKSTLTVQGWSMRPLIDYGDTVCIDHGEVNIRAGSVYAFRWGQKIVVHRVLRRAMLSGEWVYVSKGDSNRNFDPLIRGRSVIGRVVSLQKQGSSRPTDLGRLQWQLYGAAMVFWGCFASVLPADRRRLAAGNIIRRILSALKLHR